LGAEMFVESSAMDSAAYLIFHALVHQYDWEQWQTNKGYSNTLCSLAIYQQRLWGAFLLQSKFPPWQRHPRAVTGGPEVFARSLQIRGPHHSDLA
jgi:hypothetical protein